MDELKKTIHTAINELSALGRLTDILTAAAAVNASIDALEKSVNQLCLLLVPKVGAEESAHPQTNLVTGAGKSMPFAQKIAEAMKATTADPRKGAPARDEVKKRITTKLRKDGPMSQAGLIKTLHHDYYNVATALKELHAVGAVKEGKIFLKGIDGQPTRRSVKVYMVV